MIPRTEEELENGFPSLLLDNTAPESTEIDATLRRISGIKKMCFHGAMYSRMFMLRTGFRRWIRERKKVWYPGKEREDK